MKHREFFNNKVKLIAIIPLIIPLIAIIQDLYLSSIILGIRRYEITTLQSCNEKPGRGYYSNQYRKFSEKLFQKMSLNVSYCFKLCQSTSKSVSYDYHDEFHQVIFWPVFLAQFLHDFGN